MIQQMQCTEGHRNLHPLSFIVQKHGIRCYRGRQGQNRMLASYGLKWVVAAGGLQFLDAAAAGRLTTGRQQ